MKKVEFNYFKNGGNIRHLEVFDIDFHLEEKLIKSIELVDEVETEVETLTEFEVVDSINSIQIMLDSLDENHIQIITALNDEVEKISKYAYYLANGGSETFDLETILNTINA